jgi:TPR repeat protein
MQDLLKKRDQLKQQPASSPAPSYSQVFDPLDYASPPMILRTTTVNEEVIYSGHSSFPDAVSPPLSKENVSPTNQDSKTTRSQSPKHRFRPSLHIRKRSKNGTEDEVASPYDGEGLSPTTAQAPRHRSLSGRLKRFSITPRSRTTSSSSINVPDDLPSIPLTLTEGIVAGSLDHDAEWERRAALLAQHQRARTPSAQSIALSSPSPPRTVPPAVSSYFPSSKNASNLPLAQEEIDAQIQLAISLHESGELERSTAIFRNLANPQGANNAFSQTLYGLALRHGWGCTPDPEQALHFHTLAASNSAAISMPTISEKPQSGDTPTTTRTLRAAARGELVLAIYELGNAFRHGLGCISDPVAARKYYETAAELGDTDAMMETAWCYENGYGGEKDKWRAARYYRIVESKGTRLTGMSWIHKDKYVSEIPPGKEQKDRDKAERKQQKEDEKREKMQDKVVKEQEKQVKKEKKAREKSDAHS